MQERDERDRRREVAPMVPVGDASLLDTTNMDADAAFEAAYEFVMLHYIENGRSEWLICGNVGYCVSISAAKA